MLNSISKHCVLELIETFNLRKLKKLITNYFCVTHMFVIRKKNFNN